jgi:hypothetical protein
LLAHAFVVHPPADRRCKLSKEREDETSRLNRLGTAGALGSYVQANFL